MPRSKEFVESDDSSASGSSSEAEKKGKKRPKKQAKKESKQEEAKGAASSKKSKIDDEEPTWDLGNNYRVAIREFKGKTLIDIRQMYEDKNSGELKPGKKGISLNTKLWRSFMDVVQEVDETVKEKC